VTDERLNGRAAAGDEIPAACEIIELRIVDSPGAGGDEYALGHELILGSTVSTRVMNPWNSGSTMVLI
jgi:hypothetical protein